MTRWVLCGHAPNLLSLKVRFVQCDPTLRRWVPSAHRSPQHGAPQYSTVWRYSFLVYTACNELWLSQLTIFIVGWFSASPLNWLTVLLFCYYHCGLDRNFFLMTVIKNKWHAKSFSKSPLGSHLQMIRHTQTVLVIVLRHFYSHYVSYIYIAI